MCGIFGYFDREKKELEPALLFQMGKALEHRGPDDKGIFRQAGVAIGNLRLSIVDIAGGHQPFVSSDRKITVVQNGQIYNYIELAQELSKKGFVLKTKSDTEVILRLYECYGINFVSKLNGMFCIAIFDEQQDCLYLIRDRIGVKPLFLHDDGKRLFFASEIKALLRAGVPAEISFQGLDSFLTYNYVPPPYTIYKDIYHLMPGHLLRIGRNRTDTFCWWDLASIEAKEIEAEKFIDEFNSTLEDAVRIRLRADVPCGSFLSGGADSSTITGLMTNHAESVVKSFCIGFHDARFDESLFAEEASIAFGTQHFLEKVGSEIFDLWPLVTYFCDQPHGDISFLPTYCVSKMAAKHVKVVLTGDGGDELFAGYDKYRDFFSSNYLEMSKNDFQSGYYKNISLFSNEEKSNLYNPQILKQTHESNPYELAKKLYSKVDHMDRINQALYLDTMLLLPGNNLVKPDRMGMAVSLEARTPFLDYRIVELAFSMPGHFKLKDGVTKDIYKKAVLPLIGDKLAYRQKQMFTVPVGEWFKKQIAKTCEKIVSTMSSGEDAWFNKDYIQKLFMLHQSGKRNCTRELRAILSIEIWRRIFIEKKCTSPPCWQDLM